MYRQSAKYCDERVCMSACMSVSMSVFSRISKTTRPNFMKFSLHVTHGRGPSLL